MYNKVFISPPKYLSRSFTLIELIVVIIIVGILAAVGISQYSTTVEKSRLAEAKIRIGAMRQLTHEYYINNGTLTGITYGDVGVNANCSTASFFTYSINAYSDTNCYLQAYRCTSGGKTPNGTRQYNFYMIFIPSTGFSSWRCHYTEGGSEACFGFPT